MTPMLSRRDLLAGAAGATAALGLGNRAVLSQTVQPIRLTAERRTLDVNGRAASVFAIRQPDGTPGVFLDHGQRFVVALENRSGEDTIVHWHGQTPPVRQDGVAETGLVSLIGNGASQAYDYAPRSGTYWMHSHHGLQEQLLMGAPLVVRTADDLRADVQDVTILLQDFTFRNPAEVLAGLGGRTGMASMGAGASDSGTQRMDTGRSAMPGMQMGGTAMPGMEHMPMEAAGHTATPKMPTPSGHGTPKTGPIMDLNDIEFDAYLANDRTLADPLVVRAERNSRVRVRLINGAASTAFWIEFGALDVTGIAVDGDAVHPVVTRRFSIAEAQRVDVLVQVPPDGGAFPVLAQREGDRQRTGFILAVPGARVAEVPGQAAKPVGPADLSLERRLRAVQPLLERKPDVVHRVALTGTMMPYSWGIDGRAWANRRPLMIAHGQRVVIDIVNQTQMAHPMHLHGHRFQVVALNGRQMDGAMRDTVLVPTNGSVRIAFDADNPGRWLFHCHNLYHMVTGMITEVNYEGFA